MYRAPGFHHVSYHLSTCAHTVRRIRGRSAPGNRSILLARSCEPRPARENISPYRQVAIVQPRRYSALRALYDRDRFTGVENPAPRGRASERQRERERISPPWTSSATRSVPFIANDTRTGCIEGVIVSSGVFISQWCSREEEGLCTGERGNGRDKLTHAEVKWRKLKTLACTPLRMHAIG